jgi:hypothetical protein
MLSPEFADSCVLFVSGLGIAEKTEIPTSGRFYHPNVRRGDSVPARCRILRKEIGRGEQRLQWYAALPPRMSRS